MDIAGLLDPQRLNLLLDVLLFACIAALGGIWLRNSRRQRRLEASLKEAAEQLEAASRHLREATQLLDAARKDESACADAGSGEAGKAPEPRQPERCAHPAAARRAYQTQIRRRSGDNAANHADQLSMVLRMRREGESPASIADKLDLPLAQVRLLLKLQGEGRH